MTEIKKIEGFTPGPWDIKEQMHGIYWLDKAGNKNFGTIGTVLDCHANASLIAYAPDLYKIALEQQDEIKRLKGLLKKELHDKVIGEGFHEIAFTVRWLEYSRLNNL